MKTSKDFNRIRGTTMSIQDAAYDLRQALTTAEANLWEALRGRKLGGFKFRCQHPVGRFIVDFYYPICKLAIEVDGDVHSQQKSYDRHRTDQLQSFGYFVLRFTNNEVMNDLSNVLYQTLEMAAEVRCPTESPPSPQ